MVRSPWLPPRNAPAASIYGSSKDSETLFDNYPSSRIKLNANGNHVVNQCSTQHLRANKFGFKCARLQQRLSSASPTPASNDSSSSADTINTADMKPFGVSSRQTIMGDDSFHSIKMQTSSSSSSTPPSTSSSNEYNANQSSSECSPLSSDNDDDKINSPSNQLDASNYSMKSSSSSSSSSQLVEQNASLKDSETFHLSSSNSASSSFLIHSSDIVHRLSSSSSSQSSSSLSTSQKLRYNRSIRLRYPLYKISKSNLNEKWVQTATDMLSTSDSSSEEDNNGGRIKDDANNNESTTTNDINNNRRGKDDQRRYFWRKSAAEDRSDVPSPAPECSLERIQSQFKCPLRNVQSDLANREKLTPDKLSVNKCEHLGGANCQSSGIIFRDNENISKWSQTKLNHANNDNLASNFIGNLIVNDGYKLQSMFSGDAIKSSVLPSANYMLPLNASSAAQCDPNDQVSPLDSGYGLSEISVSNSEFAEDDDDEDTDCVGMDDLGENECKKCDDIDTLRRKIENLRLELRNSVDVAVLCARKEEKQLQVSKK